MSRNGFQKLSDVNGSKRRETMEGSRDTGIMLGFEEWG